MSKSSANLTFWEHIDVFRGSLIRILVAVIISAIVAFMLKEEVFSVILAPTSTDFVTYRLISLLSGEENRFSAELINTGLASQFMVHVEVAFAIGLLFVSPYVIYLLFKFISPALYESERKYATAVVVGGYAMFVSGILLNYYLIFPLTFRFLSTYQVSAEVSNYIAIDSYISTLLSLSLMMGIVFELPVVAWILGKMGILKAKTMRQSRRYAIVAILVVAAVITPTSDVFTLLVVSLPIYILYEISIFLVGDK